MNPIAVITGISGQDGSYLAEFLLSKGYTVHGVTRGSRESLGCSEHLRSRLTIHQMATPDSDWNQLLGRIRPQEFYHFAADSFVPNGWQDPLQNLESNAGLPLRILEAIRHQSPTTRLVNACSREIFGSLAGPMADENTPMQPTTPYGINKAASRWMLAGYRDRYDLFAANAILFNHESPRRSPKFVTRKISKRVAEIACGQAQTLELGSLSVQRDWGFAGDYVDAMWRMLQIENAQDFVIGTGQLHSIERFAQLAFAQVGLNWQDHVTSVDHLTRTNDSLGTAACIDRAQQQLGWQPRVPLETLVKMMVEADLGLCNSSSTVRRPAA